MTKIAYVTYQQQPYGTPDDQLSMIPLRKAGIICDSIPWDAAGIAWQEYDAIIIRSCWDYYTRQADFEKWLDLLEATGSKVYNPVSLVRENIHKKYLLDLAASATAMPRMRLISKTNRADLRQIFVEENWQKAVIKPAVSAGGTDTWLASFDTLGKDQTLIDELLQHKDMLVQEYCPAIAQGEYSLVFFNGVYSHAVCKRPQPDEFRINTKYKGTVEAATMEPHAIDTAKHILQHIVHDPLYARVDGIIENGNFRLMEVELVEPCLFFAFDEKAAGRFSEAFISRIGL